MKLIIFAVILALLASLDVLGAGLEITNIDFSIDYDDAYTYRLERKDRIDSGTVSVGNNSKIDGEVLPGSNITFTVTVENTFNTEGPTIRGVSVIMTIEEIDDGSDLEEESVDFDLEPGDDEKADVKFTIPFDVDANTYHIVVEANGDDRNGTSHSSTATLRLEVKKQSHDIRITKVLLNPGSVDCDRKAKLSVEIMNLGSNSENDIALEFKSGNLGINSYDRDITLESSIDASDEDKMYSKALNIEVPTFFKSGLYPILINLYWKGFVLFDQKNANLIVRDCDSSAPSKASTGTKENATDETQPVVTIIQPDSEKEQRETDEYAKEEYVITSTREISIFNSPILLSMLLGSFVIILLALVVIIGYLQRTKAQ